MGQSLKKKAIKHGLWPSYKNDTEIPRGIGYRKDRAEARRKARKRVSKPQKGQPWERRYTKRIERHGDMELVMWDR